MRRCDCCLRIDYCSFDFSANDAIRTKRTRASRLLGFNLLFGDILHFVGHESPTNIAPGELLNK